MYRVIAYNRKDDKEYCLLVTKDLQNARSQIDALKRFIVIFADDTKLFENVYFYIQDEEGRSVY